MRPARPTVPRSGRRPRRLSWALAIALAGLVVACGGGGGEPTPTPTVTPSSTPLAGSFSLEGLNHVSWWSTEYQGSAASDARTALSATGANWAGVLVTWYMATRDSPTIAPDGQRTPSDAALSEAIRQLHGLGLKVMLKPHVDVNDQTWRGSIRPPDTGAWFASYQAYLSQMARFAEAEKVEMLCVGTELARLSGSDFRGQWANAIAAVRADFHGEISYAANATYGGDEFSSVSFWDLVDYAGLDGYVPLTAKDDPSRAELVSAWSRNRNGEDMLSAFRNWHGSHGRPVIFTEIGYRSAQGANRAPWDYSVTAAYDPTEQADCYYAAFAVWLPERSWMRGLFWWSWDVPRPSASDTGYSPWGKPAESVLRQQFQVQ